LPPICACGAVILGKTNFPSGPTSARPPHQRLVRRGGQTNNPYGINRNPCGSSSGSGAATSANFAAVALATETDGSIVCPAGSMAWSHQATVGLTAAPESCLVAPQDTIGPHGRTVADAAAVLSVIQAARSTAAIGHWRCTAGWRGRAAGEHSGRLHGLHRPARLAGARLGITRQGVDNSPAPVVAAWELRWRSCVRRARP